MFKYFDVLPKEAVIQLTFKKIFENLSKSDAYVNINSDLLLGQNYNGYIFDCETKYAE